MARPLFVSIVLKACVLAVLSGCSVNGSVSPRGQGDPLVSGPEDSGAQGTLQVTGFGGGDSSGGNTRETSEEVIREKEKTIREDLKLILKRITMLTADLKEPNRNIPEMVLRFAKSKADGSTDESLQQTLDRAKFNFVDSECVGNDEHRAASVDANGSICISLSRVKALPPEVFNVEFYSLMLHELAHMRKYESEDEIKMIQDWVAKNPELVNLDQAMATKRLELMDDIASDLYVAAMRFAAGEPDKEIACDELETLSAKMKETFKLGQFALPNSDFDDLNLYSATQTYSWDGFESVELRNPSGWHELYCKRERVGPIQHNLKNMAPRLLEIAEYFDKLQRAFIFYAFADSGKQLELQGEKKVGGLLRLRAQAAVRAIDAPKKSWLSFKLRGVDEKNVCEVWDMNNQSILEPSETDGDGERHVQVYELSPTEEDNRMANTISLRLEVDSKDDLGGFFVSPSFEMPADFEVQNIINLNFTLSMNKSAVRVKPGYNERVAVGYVHPAFMPFANWKFRMRGPLSNGQFDRVFGVRCYAK